MLDRQWRKIFGHVFERLNSVLCNCYGLGWLQSGSTPSGDAELCLDWGPQMSGCNKLSHPARRLTEQQKRGMDVCKCDARSDFKDATSYGLQVLVSDSECTVLRCSD
jgi:hypothetical protein